MKENIYKIYFITSILFLLVLIISPFKETSTEWRAIQKKYNQISKKIPESDLSASKNLKQIWIPELNRIDRCISCHVETENSTVENVPNLFKPHPKIYHDIEKWGCTICHEGQGLATNFEDAHLPNESWDKPVLPNRYVESTCLRCHIHASLPETPNLNAGRQLVHDFNCNGCHDLPGNHDAFIPILDGIGSKVTGKNWIDLWLKNPKEFRHNTKMPNFFLSDEEIKALRDFLMQFKTFSNSVKLSELPDYYVQQKDDESFIEEGKTLFREVNCISCHSVNGEGGRVAADLGRVASKAREIWIFNFITNPQRLQSGIEMPQFGFTSNEIAAITAYINSEFFDWDIRQEIKQDIQPIQNEKGHTIFYQYNCSGCHLLTEIKIEQNRGPDNSEVGSKRLYRIYFENTSIPRTLHDYFFTKLNSPRIFGETMRMPLFNLSKKDREKITTYLLSLREVDVPDELIVRTSSQHRFNPPGEIGDFFRKFNCLKCHTINGTGNTIAPDLSMVGSRLQPDWIRKFFKNPYSIRPMIEERMLRLSFKNEEIESILNYFYLVLLDGEAPLSQDWDFSPTSQESGKTLFWEKYGCQSCHKIKGNGGTLGPVLDEVGNRLQQTWMINWILNPQKYIPETIEPKSGMSLSEAQKIVSYLISL